MEQGMKLHQYYLMTTPWWIINDGLKPMDRNVILWRVGKSLGMIK